MIKDLEKLSRVIARDSFLNENISSEIVATVEHKGSGYPIISFTLGSKNPEHPTLLLTGGIHGIERIGVQLAWSLLKTTIDRFTWDRALQDLFKNIRLVVTPLLNPVGYQYFMRSNGNGVDLMRNSPVQATEKTIYLLGGQSYSNKLPWYKGVEGEMEVENKALISIFNSAAMKSSCVIALDFHSGFGMKDRVWFPFSYTKKPFDDLAQMHALNHLFEQTHPYHIYQIEPQSKGYLLSGDIWDHIYLDFKKKNPNTTFLPLTLEMGSWSWVKKNPWQLFSRQGVFNPVKEHRVKRTYRRHNLLFDFLLKAINSHQVWSTLEPSLQAKHKQLGMERWYG